MMRTVQRTWRRPLIALSAAAALVTAACTADDGDADPPASEATTAASEGAASNQPSTTDTPSGDTAPPPTDTAAPTTEPAPALAEDRSFYILPPGNYGGLPTTAQSTDQLPLYDGLTPARTWPRTVRATQDFDTPPSTSEVSQVHRD